MAEVPDPLGDLEGKGLRDLKYALKLLVVGTEVENFLHDYLSTGRVEFDPIPEGLANIISGPIGAAEKAIGQPLFELLINAPTGAQLSDNPGAEEGIAVSMVQRMLGFAIALPYGISRIKMLLEAAMGESAAKGIVEALEKIPEDIGINWALGNVLDRILEVGAARPIEEAIAEKTRPQRLEWPQLRALARMHAIPDDRLQELLAKAGWRDVDIPLLKQVDRARLAVADIQQAFVAGLRDELWVHDYLGQIGIEGEDADLIIELYLKRAETAGGDQLRAVAQRAFIDGNMSEAEYRSILAEVHVPQLSIDLEVRAATLARDTGRKVIGVAEVKTLHAEGVIDDAQAIARLEQFGYSQEDAGLIVEGWKRTNKAARSGLSESQILSYMVSGVITKAEALQHLLDLNIRPEDAAFLVANPSAAKPVKNHGLTSATILSAMVDGLIDAPTAEAKLEAAGETHDDAVLEVQLAFHKAQRQPKPKKTGKALGEAQILEALRLQLANSAWATRELVTLGYSDTDALILVTIEETKANKAIPPDWTTLT